MIRILTRKDRFRLYTLAVSGLMMATGIMPLNAKEQTDSTLEIDLQNGGYYYLRTGETPELKYKEIWYKDVKLEFDVEWYRTSSFLDVDANGTMHANQEGEYTLGYSWTYTKETMAALKEKYPDDDFSLSDVGYTMHFVVSDNPFVFRLYNPHSGEHFYTSDKNERGWLIQAGWSDEGYGWLGSDSSEEPVYRLYDPNAGDHHYTMNKEEYEHLAEAGWKQEGIAWYCDPDADIPVYRQYNPNAKSGRHNQTADVAEKTHLISLGWKDEGIAWSTPVIQNAAPAEQIPPTLEN